MISLKVQVTSAGLIINGKKQIRATMRKAGAEVAAAARRKIGPKGSGASKPGAPPNSVSGKLKRSIKVVVFKSGEGVAIRASAFYAKFLEEGAKGGGGKTKGKRNLRGKPSTQRVLLPRPFLTQALDERRNSIGQRIHDAVVKDIQFVKLK